MNSEIRIITNKLKKKIIWLWPTDLPVFRKLWPVTFTNYENTCKPLNTHLYMYPRLEKANTEYASMNRIFVVVSENKKLRILCYNIIDLLIFGTININSF